MKFSKKVLLPVIMVLATLLAACGSSSTSGGTQTSTQAAKAPDKQQILVYPIAGVADLATLDPALAEDVYSSQAIGTMFNGLVTYNNKTQIVPDLAKSYDLSKDGLSWTFHLRPDLKFSDGTALTSADVVYSIDRALQPATKSGFAINELGPIKDADKLNSGKIKTIIGDSLLAPDPQTVVIITSKKAAYLLDALTVSVGNVLEKSFVEKNGTSWTDHLADTGSGGNAGPWILQNYTRSKSLTFVPNPYYFGTKPQLKKVVMPLYSQKDTTYKDYQVNRVDFSFVPTIKLNDAKALPSGQYRTDPSLRLSWFAMNYLVKPFDNIKIRQAFSLAVNRDLIATKVWKDSVTPSYHIIPNGTAGYNPDLTGPAGVKSTAGDATTAKKLFQEGLQEEGMTTATMPPIVFEVSSQGIQDQRDMYAAIQQMWQSTFGIPVKVNDIDFNKLVKDITGTVGNTNLMAFAIGWTGTPDPQNWMTNQFGPNSTINLGNYGNNQSTDAAQQKQAQQLMEQADAEVASPEQRAKLYDQAEQQLVNDVAWLTLYQVKTVYVVKPCVANWPHNPFGQAGIAYQPDWANIYITNAGPCANTADYQ
ncbi:peptide ABC transporter substrate-binding protein [Ktedonosporobacter rubrisoli]|nr:peptide ABC transporter substrate-binding protein [Ktedonosporobacter rubrisoli]